MVKPLDGMGGESIFQLNQGDQNLKVILETITGHDSELVMAQKYIPEITAGDKRILMVNGEPVPYALARLPGAGDFRGNLAKGGSGKGLPLSERDYWIAPRGRAAPCCAMGILFAGLDVIGDWLTEINVTSPTCIRELDAEFGLNIAGQPVRRGGGQPGAGRGVMLAGLDWRERLWRPVFTRPVARPGAARAGAARADLQLKSIRCSRQPRSLDVVLVNCRSETPARRSGISRPGLAAGWR